MINVVSLISVNMYQFMHLDQRLLVCGPEFIRIR